MPERDAREAQTYEDARGCLARLIWMAAGNLLLVFLAMSIAREPTFAFGPLDLAYWGVVAGTMVARYLDVSRFGGRTSDGAPATMAHFRRYAAILVGVAGLGWLAAHSLEL